MRLTLSIRGDELTADFAGSSPQMAAAVNSSLAVAAAGLFSALKSILDPVGLINAGSFRPIKVLAPEASIVSARPYAPAGAHGEVRKRAVSCTIGALAQIIPELVSGDLCGTSFHNMLGGTDPSTGRSYVYYEAPQGGNGGFAGGDGPSAMGNIDFGDLKLVVPAESIEQEYPLLVEESVLRPDSAGDGAYRGGLGFRRSVRLLAGETSYSLQADRGVIPPYGVEGGYAAAPVRTAVTRAGRELPFSTPGKVFDFQLRPGDTLTFENAGGGGYGDPLERDPERVRADLAEGYISPERASDRYGVVFTADGRIDEAATRRRRAALAAERPSFPMVGCAEAVYVGKAGRRRVCRLHPDVAARIAAPADALIELRGLRGAPLRAWVEPDPDEPPDAVALDDFALRVLGLAPGERVWLRLLTPNGRVPSPGTTIDRGSS
jgi:N-methylhydantoinase B